MSTRLGAILLPAILAAAFAVPAVWPAPTLAQTNRRFLEPPSNLPRIQGNLNLDRLFAALKVAPDDESAKYVENRIWALWIATDSDTTTLLMSRVKTAVDAKDLDLGIKLLTAIINIKPDYIEAWNRRATLYYMKKDFDDSLVDIHELSDVPGIDKAFVYGSWAARYHGERGASPRDIDLLVIGEPELDALYAACRRVEKELRLDVNPVVRSRAEWQRRGSSFLADVRKGPLVTVVGAR